MQKRSPIGVFILSLITAGIYHIVWLCKTTTELRNLGYDVPTRWMLIIPFANIYWLWCYSKAVEEATGGQNTQLVYFIVQMLLGAIGQAIIQNDFNRVPDRLISFDGNDDIKITVERVG